MRTSLGQLLAIAVLASLALLTPRLSAASGAFFGDEVLVRGQGIEIRQKALDEAFLQFKANATLRNQPIPEANREELEAMLLDRLVVTRLLMNRAVESDREKGDMQAKKFVENVIQEAGSETAFNRQLLALGFTRESFENQVYERAVSEEVVERELHGQVTISDTDIEVYYASNRDKLMRPEMLQVQHILRATRDPQTGAEVSDTQKAEQRLLTEKILKRARDGEDFQALIKEFSEDPGVQQNNGEYIFSRGQMVPQFEAAAFSMTSGQISDPVTTPYGYHIIKLIRRIPPEPIPLDQLKEDLREKLRREKVQKSVLPAHLKKLKAAANLEYFKGARPPSEPALPVPSP